jgi:hypothetical protein
MHLRPGRHMLISSLLLALLLVLLALLLVLLALLLRPACPAPRPACSAPRPACPLVLFVVLIVGSMLRTPHKARPRN